MTVRCRGPITSVNLWRRNRESFAVASHSVRGADDVKAEKLRCLDDAAKHEPNERRHIGGGLIAVQPRNTELVVAPSAFKFAAARGENIAHPVRSGSIGQCDHVPIAATEGPQRGPEHPTGLAPAMYDDGPPRRPRRNELGEAVQP